MNPLCKIVPQLSTKTKSNSYLGVQFYSILNQRASNFFKTLSTRSIFISAFPLLISPKNIIPVYKFTHFATNTNHFFNKTTTRHYSTSLQLPSSFKSTKCCLPTHRSRSFHKTTAPRDGAPDGPKFAAPRSTQLSQVAPNIHKSIRSPPIDPKTGLVAPLLPAHITPVHPKNPFASEPKLAEQTKKKTSSMLKYMFRSFFRITLALGTIGFGTFIYFFFFPRQFALNLAWITGMSDVAAYLHPSRRDEYFYPIPDDEYVPLNILYRSYQTDLVKKLYHVFSELNHLEGNYLEVSERLSDHYKELLKVRAHKIDDLDMWILPLHLTKSQKKAFDELNIHPSFPAQIDLDVVNYLRKEVFYTYWDILMTNLKDETDDTILEKKLNDIFELKNEIDQVIDILDLTSLIAYETKLFTYQWIPQTDQEKLEYNEYQQIRAIQEQQLKVMPSRDLPGLTSIPDFERRQRELEQEMKLDPSLYETRTEYTERRIEKEEEKYAQEQKQKVRAKEAKELLDSQLTMLNDLNTQDVRSPVAQSEQAKLKAKQLEIEHHHAIKLLENSNAYNFYGDINKKNNNSNGNIETNGQSEDSKGNFLSSWWNGSAKTDSAPAQTHKPSNSYTFVDNSQSDPRYMLLPPSVTQKQRKLSFDVESSVDPIELQAVDTMRDIRSTDMEKRRQDVLRQQQAQRQAAQQKQSEPDYQQFTQGRNNDMNNDEIMLFQQNYGVGSNLNSDAQYGTPSQSQQRKYYDMEQRLVGNQSSQQQQQQQQQKRQ